MQSPPAKQNGEDGLPLPPYRVYNIGTSHPERIRACGAAERVQLSRGDWYQLYVTMRGRELP